MWCTQAPGSARTKIDPAGYVTYGETLATHDPCETRPSYQHRRLPSQTANENKQKPLHGIGSKTANEKIGSGGAATVRSVTGERTKKRDL